VKHVSKGPDIYQLRWDTDGKVLDTLGVEIYEWVGALRPSIRTTIFRRFARNIANKYVGDRYLE